VPGKLYRAAVLAEQSARFRILAKLAGSTEEVFPATPTQSSVAEGYFRYFRFLVPEEHDETIRVTVTPFTGQPDLYLSRGKEPTLADYDLVSPYALHDLLEVKLDSTNMTTTSEWFYIGVYGMTESIFTLTAKIRDDTITQLLPGVEVESKLDDGGVELYALDIPVAQDFNITTWLSLTVGNVMP
jgi:hypothetical protein